MRAGAARFRPPLGWPGAAATRVCRVVPRSGGGPTSCCGHQPVRCPSGGLPSPRRRGGVCRRPGPHPARRAEPGGLWAEAGGHRERAAAVPPVSADGARSGVVLRVSPLCAGSGGRLPHGIHVRRGREHRADGHTPAQACDPRAQGAGSAAPTSPPLPGVSSACTGVGPRVCRGVCQRSAALGPIGTRQAGSRGRIGAEQRRAGDRQQPPLVPRSGSWRRLMPSVRPCGRKAPPQDREASQPPPLEHFHNLRTA